MTGRVLLVLAIVMGVAMPAAIGLVGCDVVRMTQPAATSHAGVGAAASASPHTAESGSEQAATSEAPGATCGPNIWAELAVAGATALLAVATAHMSFEGAARENKRADLKNRAAFGAASTPTTELRAKLEGIAAARPTEFANDVARVVEARDRWRSEIASCRQALLEALLVARLPASDRTRTRQAYVAVDELVADATPAAAAAAARRLEDALAAAISVLERRYGLGPATSGDTK